MTRSPPVPAALVADPAWLVHRYDPGHDAFHLVVADRAARAAATFLTDEHLPSAARPAVVPRAAALAAAPAPQRLQFIFHAAYCCSTLLAQVLDVPGLASTLKEPVVLNDLVGWRHRGGEPKRIAAVLDGALTLLARSFEAGEQVVVKPSNVVNALAPAMLAMRPDAHALLLHASLPAYLTSIARKGMWGRLWVRDLLAKQLMDDMVHLGFEPGDYLRHTDLQAAAVGWLAQMDLFRRLAERFPGRVRSLDSEQLLARPREAMDALGDLYGFAPGVGAQLAASDAFARNAKDGSAFTSGDRSRERSDGAALHADEIGKVQTWAEAVARQAGVPLVPPAPLLPD